ncbi:hypothetical protein D9M68_367560 [compost metagenome]
MSLIPEQKDLLHNDSGVSTIEYALLSSLIAMAIIGAVLLLSDAVKSLYASIAASMP